MNVVKSSLTIWQSLLVTSVTCYSGFFSAIVSFCFQIYLISSSEITVKTKTLSKLHLAEFSSIARMQMFEFESFQFCWFTDRSQFQALQPSNCGNYWTRITWKSNGLSFSACRRQFLSSLNISSSSCATLAKDKRVEGLDTDSTVAKRKVDRFISSI